MTTPDRLKTLRIDRGLSIRQAAKAISVGEMVIRYAEQGGQPWPQHKLKIATFYGLKPSDLWPPT
jgi:hypothetical protein